MHKQLNKNLFLMAADGMKVRAKFLNGWVSGTLYSPGNARVYGADAQIETPEHRMVYFEAHQIEYISVDRIEAEHKDPYDGYILYEQLLTMNVSVEAPHLR